MSKINDIKGTYEPLIGKKMFNIFVEGDKTPTKKYLKWQLCEICFIVMLKNNILYSPL